MTRLYIIFLLLFSISTTMGCSPIGSSHYTPYKDITVKIELKRFEKISDPNVIFLYFTLQIENNSTDDYFFNPSQLKVKLNGYVDEDVCYDSLASVDPTQHKLIKGNQIYKLYFIFSKDLNISNAQNFEILDFGIRTEQDKE